MKKMRMIHLLIAMRLIERSFWVLRYIGTLPSGWRIAVFWLVGIDSLESEWELLHWLVIA